MKQCSVKSFYLSVPLGVIGCCSKACYDSERVCSLTPVLDHEGSLLGNRIVVQSH